VKKGNILPRSAEIQDGDVMIALRSSGVHSNGFSLVRKCVEKEGLQWTDPAPFSTTTSTTLGEALLTPTRIYVKQLLPLLRGGFVKALAHITGGGLIDNLPRVLPPHLRAVVNASEPQWQLPPVFDWLRATTKLPQEEMLRTFNCGVGMVLIVDRIAVPAVQQALFAEKSFVLGAIRAKPADVQEQVIVVGQLHS